MVRFILIGLDGATWNLLDPWIDKGDLPSLNNLIKEGVKANFLSTIPPVTGPAWTSLATGKNPGKHGIFGFNKLDNGKLKLYTHYDIKCSSIHEILSKNGIGNIIIGLPLSYPPSKSYKGIMISDFFYHTKSIYPKLKESYLENYEVAPKLFKYGESFLNDMIKTSEKQIETVKKLFSNEPWQFFFFLFSATDHASHRFWDDMINMTPHGKKAQKVFKIADDFLGWIKDEMKKDDILIICSDHGFKGYKHTFNINAFLKKYGINKNKLTLDYRMKSVWSNIQKIQDDNIKTRNSFLPKMFKEIFNTPFLKPFVNINGNFNNFYLIKKINLIFKKKFGSPLYKERIDYNKSLAFIPSPEWMGICINKKIRNNTQLENDLYRIFKCLKYKNKKIFNRIFRKNEIFNGDFIYMAPDIIILSDDFLINFNVLIKDIITPNFPISNHKLNGIFLAYGDEIKKGVKIDFINIYDIVPTILHAFDLEIPSSIDGIVLKKIYNENSEIAKREIKNVDESVKIIDTIKALKKIKKF